MYKNLIFTTETVAIRDLILSSWTLRDKQKAQKFYYCIRNRISMRDRTNFVQLEDDNVLGTFGNLKKVYDFL